MFQMIIKCREFTDQYICIPKWTKFQRVYRNHSVFQFDYPSVWADSCPCQAKNFFCLCIGLPYLHIDLSPREDASRTSMIPIRCWPLTLISFFDMALCSGHSFFVLLHSHSLFAKDANVRQSCPYKKSYSWPLYNLDLCHLCRWWGHFLRVCLPVFILLNISLILTLTIPIIESN